MPTPSKVKTSPKKKPAAAAAPSTKKKPTRDDRFWGRVTKKRREFLARRPHHSFRLTRRRDYVRHITLPGYISFTHYVTKTLWHYKKTFGLLGLLFMALFVVLVGWQSQSAYSTNIDTLSEVVSGVFGDNANVLGRAGVYLVSAITTVGRTDYTAIQGTSAVVMLFMLWLTAVWLLRNSMAGRAVKLRDGLYNAGAPILSTACIACLVVLQFVPLAVAVIVSNAATTTGLLASGGAVAMLFWIAVVLLGVLSLYWWTSSIIALVIVTLPGMYPYQAIKLAGDLVLGYRVKILCRWLWMLLVAIIAEIIILFPAILIDMALRAWLPAVAAWLPVVPFVMLASVSFIVMWIAAYVYLFYRKLVDNEEPIGQR